MTTPKARKRAGRPHGTTRFTALQEQLAQAEIDLHPAGESWPSPQVSAGKVAAYYLASARLAETDSQIQNIRVRVQQLRTRTRPEHSAFRDYVVKGIALKNTAAWRQIAADREQSILLAAEVDAAIDHTTSEPEWHQPRIAWGKLKWGNSNRVVSGSDASTRPVKCPAENCTSVFLREDAFLAHLLTHPPRPEAASVFALRPRDSKDEKARSAKAAAMRAEIALHKRGKVWPAVNPLKVVQWVREVAKIRITTKMVMRWRANYDDEYPATVLAGIALRTGLWTNAA